AISGRTSYLQVRLAYHLYPHLIQHFCNSGRFGPPRRVNFASAWTWVAHLVSCRMHATSLALVRLAFALAAAVTALAGHTHSLAGSFSKRHAITRLPSL